MRHTVVSNKTDVTTPPSTRARGSRNSCVDEADNAAAYGLELVVIGSQPCRITRTFDAAIGRRTIVAEGGDFNRSTETTSIQVSSPLVQDDCCPTTCPLLDGDIIEPYLRDPEGGMTASQSEFERAGKYLPFVISIAHEGSTYRSDAGTAFAKAFNRLMHEEERMVKESQDTIISVVEVEEEMMMQDKKDQTVAKASEVDEKQAGGISTAAVTTKGITNAADVEKYAPSVNKRMTELTKPKVGAVIAATHIKSTGHATKLTSAEASDEQMSSAGQDILICSPVADAGEASVTLRKQGAAQGPAHKATEMFCEKAEDVQMSDVARSEDMASNVPSMEPSIQEAAQELPSSSSSSEEDESSENDHDVDNPRDEIVRILQGVYSPGSFATSGSCWAKFVMLGIEVDGIGLVGLPLSDAQAKILAARCEQAPFGRGSKTIVDTCVRNTYQLAPEQFKITNPHWESEISSLLSNVRQDLGVQSHLKVEAQRYKLLLYEERSFFAMHRDSEKVQGMFGTLVVVLPTAFAGGELVVKHQGKIKQFAQSHSSAFGSQYAAFYADCKHELKPVTSGHRLCLVYNLVKTGAGACPTAQRNRRILKQLKHAFGAWAKSFDGQNSL